LALRILIIEDDEKIGATLMEVFAREGYWVTLSRTGEHGFFRWGTDNLDRVVLDTNSLDLVVLDLTTASQTGLRELPPEPMIIW
jgi:DNA-binding response OmpR family regulator